MRKTAQGMGSPAHATREVIVHAIRVLEEDHARIEALFERLADADDARDRDWLFERLEKELTVHTLAEDNIFLPHVEEAVEDTRKATQQFFDEDALAEASGLLAAAYENNGEIRTLMEQRQAARTEEKTEELSKAVRLHVELEESLFPRAEKVLEAEDFERMGDLIEHCKWQVWGLAQARLASSSSYRPSPM